MLLNHPRRIYSPRVTKTRQICLKIFRPAFAHITLKIDGILQCLFFFFFLDTKVCLNIHVYGARKGNYFDCGHPVTGDDMVIMWPPAYIDYIQLCEVEVFQTKISKNTLSSLIFTKFLIQVLHRALVFDDCIAHT